MNTPPKRPRKQRSDAARSREHILSAAEELLQATPGATMESVAQRAHVSRGTLYRHFPTRADLLHAVGRSAHDRALASGEDRLRAPGALARVTPTPLSVADVLNQVPPHMLGEQVVAEAHRIDGVAAAAVYLVDLDGVRLTRLAGPPSFPRSFPVPLAVGTEVPTEGLPAMRAAVAEHLGGALCAPLLLRGRALGVLAVIGTSEDGLAELAYEAAAALDLAAAYTDHLDTVRRTHATSPAAEIQQNLLPPRLVRTTGALIAGNVLPGYEIGGDWFDYAENPEGTWLGIADTTGTGTRPAALASVALGAFRSARHQDLDLPATVALMDRTVRELGIADTTVAVVLARWNPATATLAWVACGSLGPIHVAPDGTGVKLPTGVSPALGDPAGPATPAVHEQQFGVGDRVVLASDGVIDRTYPESGTLGIDGLVDAVRSAPPGSAAGAVSAIEAVLRQMNAAPLHDDATLVVLAPTGASAP